MVVILGCVMGGLVLSIAMVVQLTTHRLGGLAASSNKVKPADLRTINKDFYDEISAASPPGSLGALEPVAALPWAFAIAQAWSPDVRPDAILINRQRPDGTVNVLDDSESEIRYRFLSQDRLQEARRQSDLGGPKLPTTLDLFLKKGKIMIQIDQDMMAVSVPEAQPPYPASLAMPRIMESALASGKLPQLPFYRAHLVSTRSKTHWEWSVMTMGDSSNSVWVEAKDGQLVR
jgi:hypothetical protein